MTPSQMQFRWKGKKSIFRVEGLFFVRRLEHTESVGLRPSPITPEILVETTHLCLNRGGDSEHLS